MSDKYADVEITRFSEDEDGVVSHEPILEEAEPFFLLRGKDATAPDAVIQYAEHARRKGRIDLATSADEVARSMVAWQQAHSDKVKLPD